MKSKSGKTIRRISILAALVALICMALAGSVMAETTVVIGDKCYTHGDIIEDGIIEKEDAIYLLYHSVFGEEAYPLTNYEKDGEITALDAIELFAQVGTAGEKIHAYSEPVWQWDGGTAKAVFACECGDEDQVITKYATVTSEKHDATCVEPGSITFKATANFTEKAVYTTETTVETDAATGNHTYNTDVKCVDRTCSVCQHVEEAEAHNYEVASTTTATCTKAATTTYACKDCGTAEYTVENGIAAGHTYGVAKETHVDGCEYKEVYECSVCDSEVDGEHYYKHVETAQITDEATCSHAGTKLYTCSKCNATHEEEIAKVADAHTWDDGTTKGTLITYECKEASCTATRTAINAVEEKVAEVNSTVLAETKEIDLNGTSLKLDDATAGQLTGNVEIKAEEKKATELALTPEQKEQIGENPVYDFSIKDDKGAVTNFDGSITISLPYELQEGDDADCIDVWFIADDGTVTIEEGTYANGYVTFTATHFSYYTVTRLTPEQRCEKYGHNDATNSFAATCTEEGYTIKVCARCGRTEKTVTAEPRGHVVVTTVTDATCTEAGKTVITCENCDYKSTSEIPATGHTWEETTETATCAKAKTVTVGCKSCDAEKEIVLARLKHETETTSVAATCETAPYDLTTCKNCDYKVTEYTGAALGHEYDVAWTWDKEAITAKATFTCGNENCESTFEKEATITITKELPVSCEEDGYVDYLAKVVYNAQSYTDEYQVVTPATGHNVTEEWQYNALQHYHECSICESKLEAADHGMDDGVITKEATCTEAGEIVYSCDVCEYQLKESIPAPGHKYENGVCTECGYGTALCQHDTFYLVEKEFTTADGYCGGVFSYETCDCGEVSYFNGYEFDCDFEYEGGRETDENGYVKYVSTATCQDCGLHLDETSNWVIDADECIGTMYMNVKVSDKNGNELLVFNGIEVEDVEHPNAVYGTPDDLTAYGLCGGEVTKVYCPCGQNAMLMIDSDCEWVEVPDECGEGVSTAICSVCNTKVVNEYDTEELGQCRLRYTDVYTFYKDGAELVSYEYSFETDNHDLDYTFDLEGETCSDGYTVHETCSVCGYEESYFEKAPEGRHYEYYQIIDVSEYDLCVDEMNAWMCPCGEVCNVDNVYWDHNFETLDWSEEETNDGYIIYGLEECIDCGFTREYTNVVTYTGNGCECEYNYTCDYSVDGKVIISEKQNYTEANHAFEVIGYELNGTSCEDGVKLTYECSECGVVETETTYYHESFVKESYNAADYGMCDGQIIVHGCACGENGWINEDTDCVWEEVSYDSETGTHRYECSECGIINDITETEEELDGCQIRCTEVYEYIKDTTVVLKLQRTYITDNHNFTYTFDIAEGASCDDGYTVNMVCQDCDETRSWFVQPEAGEHERYKVATYDMSDYGFCDGYLHVMKCPCGAENSIGWWENNCSWNWYGVDEETGASIVKCMTCGGTRHIHEEEGEADGCYVEYNVTNVFYDKNGVEKLSISTQELYSNHDFEITFEIEEGATCSDGYTVIRTCKVCEEVYTAYESAAEGDHDKYWIQSYDLADYGFCGGVMEIATCPCGAEKDYNWDGYDYCDYEWVEDETTGEGVDKCTVCGGYYTSEWDYEQIDACHEKEVGNCTVYSPNGEKVVEAEYAYIYAYHNDICTFELSGSSCLDGYTVTMTCQECGEVRQGYSYDHEIYDVARTDLTEYGLCGGEIVYGRCACGEEESTWSYQDCRWNQVGYDDETNTWTYECPTCLTTKVVSEAESEKDANCMVYRTQNVKFYKADGSFATEYNNTYSSTSHDCVYEFDLLGTSCEDGYYMTQICKDCNYTWENTNVYTGHNNWCVEAIDLTELGLCGGEIRHFQCACGENNGWSQYGDNCSWNWNAMNSATCSVCGVTKTTESSVEEIDACHTKNTYTYTYTKDGVELFSYVDSHVSESHDAVFTLSLNNPDGDCTNGFTATGICSVCNENVVYTGYHHGVFTVEKKDLAELGLCEGNVIVKQQCACGDSSYTGTMGMGGCSWMGYGYDENGMYREECTVCGTTRTHINNYGEKNENCEMQAQRIYTYYDAEGTQVYTYEETWTAIEHNPVMTGVQMTDPTDCEAGYVENYSCSDCGKTYSESYSYHKNVLAAEYDLSEYGVCGEAYVNVYKCYCGEYQYMNYNLYDCEYYTTHNDYTDDNGVEHSVRITRCDVCDLMLKQDRVSEYDTVNCKETVTNTVTITVGDVAVAEPFTVINTNDYHEFEQTATLVDGATSCDDGVVVTTACKNCDYSYEDEYDWHYDVEVARYDLTEYGSSCGGYVVEKACACGEFGYVSFDDMECDWDSTCVKSEQAYETQYTTSGNSSYWDYEYLVKCAVTSPECGLCIYESDYHVWDEENCEMLYCTSWKLGYDETDGTYDKEIVVVLEKYAYHAYETTTSEDGYTTTGVCKHCGSSYVDSQVYDADYNLIYEELSATNTLDNGESKYRSRIYEYEVYNGYRYETKYYNDMTYADGREWWIHYDYEYDWDNFDCTRTRIETDSNGKEDVLTQNCHQGGWYWSTIEESTCTQYGSAQYVCDCPVCEQTIKDPAFDTTPDGHCWCYDYDKEIYVCCTCGLENINGADGSIIFEDMTDYTMGTEYIIGYYQRNQVQFSYELLAVLGTDEIPLDGITFTELTKAVDGINAITFKMADADAAAVAALEAAGYTDTTGFALRFVFIPESSDGDFDYAITLTDESIAE